MYDFNHIICRIRNSRNDTKFARDDTINYSIFTTLF